MSGGELALIRSTLARTYGWRGRRPPVRALVRAMLKGGAGEASHLADQFPARGASPGAGLAHPLRAASVPVLVGGAAFHRTSDLWRRVGATGHGADARIGTVLARRLARP